MILYTSDKQRIKLLEENFITSGGEGLIYKVGNQAAKIYISPDKAKEMKIQALISKGIELEGLCLPTDSLYDRTGLFKGFLMPLALGKQLQYSVFGKARLKRSFPKWNRIDLCELVETILEKIVFLHDRDILLGDINPLNIHVASSKEVYFLDTDSYQVDNLPCPVGSTYFIAPEIQHLNFSKQLRKKEHEYYAISTLIFMIFFPGKSPYARIGGGSPIYNIKAQKFSYPFGNKANYKAPKGPWEFIWKELPYDLKKTFHLTFTFTKKLFRFAPEQWMKQVIKYRRHLLSVPATDRWIFPEAMEKLRDNVSTSMPNDVRKDEQKNSKIETFLNVENSHRKIGVLELSTKAVKLLIGTDQVLKKEKFHFSYFPTRLGVRTNTGEFLDGNNLMDIDKFKVNVLPTIKSHVQLAKRSDVTELYSVATAAYRASTNRIEIIDLIKKEVGINVKILSKSEEARATLVAFVHTKTTDIIPANTIMIDQGGGSTEVTLFNKDKIIETYSVDLGTTILTNILLIQNNPHVSVNLGLLQTDKIIKSKLRSYLKNFPPIETKDSLCFGVGTAISKGTGKYTGRNQHGYLFTQTELTRRIYYYENILAKNYKTIGELDEGLLKQRKLIGGLDTRNILSIRLGLPIYLEILRKLNLQEITVSATSLWYGIYFDNLYKSDK